MSTRRRTPTDTEQQPHEDISQHDVLHKMIEMQQQIQQQMQQQQQQFQQMMGFMQQLLEHRGDTTPAVETKQEETNLQERSPPQREHQDDKIDIGVFSGTNDETANTFLRRFEVLCNIKKWQNDPAWKLLQFEARLRKRAATWFDGLHSSVKTSWDAVVQHFRAEFPARKPGEDIGSLMRKLYQGKRTVRDYYSEFKDICIQQAVDENDDTFKKFFLSGLRKELDVAVRAFADNKTTVQLAYLAAELEPRFSDTHSGKQFDPHRERKFNQREPSHQREQPQPTDRNALLPTPEASRMTAQNSQNSRHSNTSN